MQRRIVLGMVAMAIALLPAHETPAWEATTTHAGLTEQAAITSKLHARLKRQFGARRGLYTPLTVPPPDARALFTLLRALNPSHGYVPDGRGRLYAIGWLAAGSVVADTPTRYALNHFYDPLRKRGLNKDSYGLRHRWLSRAIGESLPAASSNAVEWVTHKQNSLNMAGFYAQYEKAVRARTPAERSRHLAGALLAAGALLHVLQDMGSPSHVRDDVAAHLEQLGSSLDVGSRFERVAAMSFGRLGIPAPRATAATDSFVGLFSNTTRTGLADITSRRWFSTSTLPRDIEIDAIRPRNIIALVARQYQVAAGTLTKPAAAGKPVFARDVAIYLTVTHTNYTYTQIAAEFGLRRSSPVLHAAARVLEAVKADPKVSATIAELKGKLAASVIGKRIDRSLRRTNPAPLNQLDLAAARQPHGARLVNDRGVCVARYRLRGRILSWVLDDACMIEQLRVILPQVASHGAGALDWLFRGELTVSQASGKLAVSAHGADFGKGALELFWDDNRGVRTGYAKQRINGGKQRTVLAQLASPPKTARRVSVLFRGVDAAGNELVATGTVRWPPKKATAGRR